MELEIFRKNGILFVRAKGRRFKALFRHCAGADEIPKNQARELPCLLLLHGARCVVTTCHRSATRKPRSDK